MFKFNSWFDKWMPIISGVTASALFFCYVVLPAVQQFFDTQEKQPITHTR